MGIRNYSLSFISFILLFHIILVPAADAATKIMPLGDSITYDDFTGDIRPDGERVAYRFSLWQLLTDAGYDFDFVGSQITGDDIFPDAENEGHPGWTDDEIVNGNMAEPGAGKLSDWLAADQPDVVLLHIGTNGLDPSPDDVADILDEIDAFSTDVWVVLALIINRSCSTDTPPCAESGTTMTFNDNIEDMALDRINNAANPAFPDKIVIVDMEANAGLDYRLQPDGDMIDDLHPNANGYAKMADVWYSALTGILTLPNSGGGGGGGGGGCFISSAATGSPMALDGKVPHKLRSRFNLANWKRLMPENISLLIPGRAHAATPVLVAGMIVLISASIVITLSKLCHSRRRLYHQYKPRKPNC